MAKKKLLLNESVTRRFMKLAELSYLVVLKMAKWSFLMSGTISVSSCPISSSSVDVA